MLCGMVQFTERKDAARLAWTFTPGRSPTVLFLPGFRSDMTGAKALEVAAWCEGAGQACLRLDYSGHGRSGGAFTDGAIGVWTADALHLIDTLTEGPLLLMGSSMGGWIMLLLALARPHRVVGLIGIAAAPDFTEATMWQAMLPAERTRLMTEGILHAPSEYGVDLPITRTLIEDGRRHLLMGAPIKLACPVRLLQGQADPDVPWETALRLAARLDAEDIQVILIKDGDHRLSRPGDLRLLRETLAALLQQCGSEPLAVAGIAPA